MLGLDKLHCENRKLHIALITKICNNDKRINKGKPIVRWGRKVMGLCYTDRQTAEGDFPSAVLFFKEASHFEILIVSSIGYRNSKFKLCSEENFL